MPLWMMGVEFGNICTVSVVELRVPSSGSPTQRVPNWWLCIPNQGNSSFISMGGQFSILTLWNWCSEAVGAWNFEILVEDSDTAGPSSIAVLIESFFTIFVPILICELCLKNDEGEAESIIKWGGWGGSSLHGKKWRKIYDPFKISSLSWLKINVCINEKVNPALLTWFTSIRRNNIPINRPLLLEELVNLLTHLIATLSRYQTNG